VGWIGRRDHHARGSRRGPRETWLTCGQEVHAEDTGRYLPDAAAHADVTAIRVALAARRQADGPDGAIHRL